MTVDKTKTETVDPTKTLGGIDVDNVNKVREGAGLPPFGGAGAGQGGAGTQGQGSGSKSGGKGLVWTPKTKP